MASKAMLIAVALVAVLVAADSAAANGRHDHGKHKGWYKPNSPALGLQGVVLCQNASYVGTPSLQNAKPLAGAKVHAVCQGGRRGGKLADVLAATDANGYFFVKVSSFFNFKAYDPTRVCKAYLSSSADPSCNVVTNINNGKVGAPFRKANPAGARAGKNLVLYSVGPFGYAPKDCKKA